MKILSIGNSFSDDATAFLHQMAASAGAPVHTVNLFIGGCSLERHWDNALHGTDTYQKQVDTVRDGGQIALQDALRAETWDVVTLQQCSAQSVDFGTYQPYLDNLTAFVKTHAPGAEIVLHETWAYADGSARLAEAGYASHAAMFADVAQAYEQARAALGGCRMIPCGEVVARMAADGYVMHRDGFHASIPLGRYVLAMVWLASLLAVKPKQITWRPDGLTRDEAAQVQGYVAGVLKQG